MLPVNCRTLLYIRATRHCISSELDSRILICNPSPCLDPNIQVNVPGPTEFFFQCSPLLLMRKTSDLVSFHRVLVNLLLYLFSGSSKVGHINMDVWNPLFRRIHGLQVVSLVLQSLPILRPHACAPFSAVFTWQDRRIG